MTKSIITGGAGFIGSHIASALLARGDEVHIVDTFTTGKRENVAHIDSDVRVHELDILATDELSKVFHGADAVYHQAALPSVPKSVAQPQLTNEANISGTLSVFVSARDAGVPRVVYASSSSVYGDTPTLPKVEDMPYAPLSPYAGQKMMGEVYAKLFGDLYGLETVGLRYFNVFGPRQDPHSEYSAVIPKFITLMKQGKAPTIFGDGTQTRDFTYVANVVDANLLAGSKEGIVTEVVNIAGGERISLNTLVEDINTCIGTGFTPLYAPPRKGDIKDSYADISKAKKVLGFEPKISFADGLKKTIESL
ncbi:MAG: SDR family oxidoreductase [Candidatus Paceibacterota bacterium]